MKHRKIAGQHKAADAPIDDEAMEAQGWDTGIRGGMLNRLPYALHLTKKHLQMRRRREKKLSIPFSITHHPTIW